MAEFKIITWNIQRGSKDEWDDLLKLKPDVALVQEYIPYREASSEYNLEYPKGSPYYESDETHRPAILIKKEYPYEPYMPVDFQNIQGQNIQGLLCCKITSPDNNKITVINIHAKTSSKIRNSTASTDYMIDILKRLTQFLKNNSGENIVLGGDLNIDVQCDKGNTHRHKDVLKNIEDLGFINCTAKCENMQTNFDPKNKLPYQNDYLYASQNLERNFNPTKCIIHNTAEFTKYKDHVPVEIRLDFSGSAR